MLCDAIRTAYHSKVECPPVATAPMSVIAEIQVEGDFVLSELLTKLVAVHPILLWVVVAVRYVSSEVLIQTH